MSKTTLGIFLAAVVLLFAALLVENTFVAGGSGLVLLVGIIYSYVVTRRDEQRSLLASEGTPAE